jgi:hypothetical protein
MTLECAGQEPCDLPLWDTRRLWSLWEMANNFHFNGVHSILQSLGFLISVSNKNMEFVRNNGGYNDPRVRHDPKGPKAISQAGNEVEFATDASRKLLSSLKCSHINNAAQSLRWWSDNDRKEWDELNTRSRALRDAIETELKDYLYYLYPKQKGEKLASWHTDWKKALDAFPDIRPDAFNATDCYALAHDTASVFHSMRVAEHGLRTLAKERKLRLPRNKPVEWATWQEIIKALDDEITAIGRTKKAGAAKDAALEFYSGARADLNGFKDEYRNLVMHVRETYDEFQALRALTNVHAFMERLSAKIDHRHRRINWGRF